MDERNDSSEDCIGTKGPGTGSVQGAGGSTNLSREDEGECPRLAEKRFLPRQMDFESLIRVLAEEHRVMAAALARLEAAATEGDFDGIAETLGELDPVFRQHIADEESQILRLLIEEVGVKGAEAEIKVFQQHRPIYKLMQLISELRPNRLQTLRPTSAC